MTTKGIYIYGIIPNFYSADMFRSLEKAGVYAIPFQNISARTRGGLRVGIGSVVDVRADQSFDADIGKCIHYGNRVDGKYVNNQR